MRKLLLLALHLALVLCPSCVQAQALPTDGPLTVRPLLQQLGERLLQGKRGSIVAIRPATGEIICLATNTPSGYDVRQAIARPHAPGSTFKVAQALVMLTEGVISEETTVECHDGYTEGNIRVGCHHHASPLPLVSAIAQSCNTWFLTTFASMINDIEGHIKEINLERDAVKEPEISENATISFYVAECMEFPTYGEYHEVDTLKEAFDKLDLIPPLRLNGNPGIGFIVHDEGSDISEAMYPLVQAGQIQYGALNLVDYYKRSPLVNGVVAECEQILKDRKEGRSGIVSPKTENQSKKKKSVFADLRQKKAMIANKASVAAKAQEAQL